MEVSVQGGPGGGERLTRPCDAVKGSTLDSFCVAVKKDYVQTA